MAGYVQADFLTFACIYSRGFINGENSSVITSLIGNGLSLQFHIQISTLRKETMLPLVPER